MEKNKTGKYFKYAIGEIALAIIGVLTALVINKENTDMDNFKLWDFYLIQFNANYKFL